MSTTEDEDYLIVWEDAALESFAHMKVLDLRLEVRVELENNRVVREIIQESTGRVLQSNKEELEYAENKITARECAKTMLMAEFLYACHISAISRAGSNPARGVS